MDLSLAKVNYANPRKYPAALFRYMAQYGCKQWRAEQAEEITTWRLTMW